MDLEVISPRVLAEVALRLEQRFGRRVTYEDPLYRHPEDMLRDEAGRRVPRGGPLLVRCPPGTGLFELLHEALSVHGSSGYPGAFAIERSEDDYHIVPTGFREADGTLARRVSLLDAVITLSAGPRTGLELVQELVVAVGAARGESVGLGTLPVNALARHVSRGRARGGKARQVLVELLRELGGCFSWQLLNNPGTVEFFLNIHDVPG